MSAGIRQKDVVEMLALFNLSDKEIAVFFVLLEKDKATASDIARALPKISRTSIYDLLANLQKLALISSFETEKLTYYKAGSAEHIIDILEEKKRALTKQQNALRTVSDTLHQLRSGTAYRPGVRFFEGAIGITAIHRELQNARKEMWSIVNFEAIHRVFPMVNNEDRLKDFQTYAVPRKTLIVHNPDGELYLRVAPVTNLHHVKWLPKSTEIKTDTLMWEGHVAIIDYAQHLNGIIIDNPTIYETTRSWFTMMWESIPEEVRQK